MSTSYGQVKEGKLKLKKKSIFKADKTKKTKKKNDEEAGGSQTDPDQLEHGGWWRITDETNFRGGIELALEAGDFSNCYLAAQDNGYFTLGPKHFNELEPHPEEVLSLIKAPDDEKFSLKTGFGRYLGVETDGRLAATAEAVGPRERFEVVFQDNKSAIQCSASNMFISWEPDKDGNVYASSKTAGPKQFLNIRTNAAKKVAADFTAAEDLLESGQCEDSYVKMYQHSKVDLKNKHISINLQDKSSIKKAKKTGNLHETLLDRRAKLKSDKYC
ncbi:unnamed protein product [Bursaphelenchus xylophilus]|uniref:(pine wood nematode) hypothetical protein n=1 Tax=Bursaphelenchus xylophilus TaxID=6326 RepID=A0A1I7RLS6_BURXY|nr:unnamed protein product [Bursaphelenchus xylophilus]CAG9106302.1 unnamed protein product [Bursaphelenchus xylophilus]